MTSKYDRYSKEELIKIIEERDRKPRLGLVWERERLFPWAGERKMPETCYCTLPKTGSQCRFCF